MREVKVIPNGCDTTPLPTLDPKPLRTPLQLIAVSRLAPNKRVCHAVEAVRLLLDRGTDTTLTVVGRGEAEQQLRQTAAQLRLDSKIIFAGGLPEAEKNEQLRRAHLLVHASVREGWGLNVLEANAMGTPAVVYPVDGLVDSTVNGVTGKITRAETPQAIADECAALLQSPATYDVLRLNAWKRSAEFQWSRVLPIAAHWLETQAGHDHEAAVDGFL